MLSCTLGKRGLYLGQTKAQQCCCYAGGSIERVLGCADGPKFYCIGNASAISNEASTASLQTECITKSKNQSAATQGKSINAGIVALAMIFLATAGVVSAQLDGPTWSNLTATTYGSKTVALTLFLQDADAGDVLVLSNMGFTVVEPLLTAGNLSAQECVNMTYLQTNVDHTGTWWNSWYEVEGCRWCSKRGQGGSGSCPFLKSLSISHTWSFNAGFNAGGTQAAKNALNKNGALNLGFSWEQSKTETFTYGCTVPQGDIASIWSRNKMGWSDTAQRYCQYAGCGQPFSCRSWSFGHVDWALNGGGPRETSCSFVGMAQCGWN